MMLVMEVSHWSDLAIVYRYRADWLIPIVMASFVLS